MTEGDTRGRASRHVRTEDLLPAPPLGRALIAGAVAAFVGAGVWAAVVIAINFESGWIAWGIGALVGFAVVKAGGHGTMLAASAGILALLSIATGKNISYQVSISDYVEENISQDHYDELQRDAKGWVALGDAPTAEQIAEFATNHGYEVPPDQLEAYFAEQGPRLAEFAAKQPSLEDLRAEEAQLIKSEYSFTDYLTDDFHPFDILFALLGIGTAFGLVQRHTTELMVAERQRIRDERDAEAAEAERAESSESAAE